MNKIYMRKTVKLMKEIKKLNKREINILLCWKTHYYWDVSSLQLD